MSLTTTDFEAVWAGVLEIVQSQLNTPSFKTWFEHTAPLELTDSGTLLVAVQSEFARSWLEERYTQLVNSALKEVTGAGVTCRFIVEPDAVSVAPAAPAPDVQVHPSASGDGAATKASSRSEFHSDYTFDTFVVGESNEFARNAALAVAEQPGLKYNPLFIWGGSGLGKTHLLHAIGSYVADNYPHKRVMYVTSEQFLNDYVAAIRSKVFDPFRQKYRNVDLLLLDDIQKFENKEGCLDQFFNIFNEMHRQNRAIVLASDRAPKDINVDERYRSRFAWGLPADIQPPNFETRLAILKQFVETQGVVFEDEALLFVAERTTPNIREMEGAVNRIIAARDLFKRPVVDRAMAEEATQGLFPDQTHRVIPISAIQDEVCRYFGLSHKEIIGSKRTHPIVFPRQVAMYLARELTDVSLPKIGSEFGGRDHTTVMHAYAKIRKLMGSQREVYNQIQQLTNMIKQRT